jgi:hypothetical protein
VKAQIMPNKGLFVMASKATTPSIWQRAYAGMGRGLATAGLLFCARHDVFGSLCSPLTCFHPNQG